MQWHKTLGHKDNRQGIKHLVYKSNKQASPCLHIVLLDTSGSMLNKQGLSNAKGVLQTFCECLYLQRQWLMLVTFGNQQVDVIYKAQAAPKSAERLLNGIHGGGGTPLDFALNKVSDISDQHKAHSQTLTILTDGRAKDSSNLPRLLMPTTLIDMEDNAVNLGRVEKLAKQLNGQYVQLHQLPQV